MTEFLIEFANVTIPYGTAFAIRFLPIWKTRDVKTKTIVIFYCCLLAYLCAGLALVKQHVVVDFQVIQYYKLLASFPTLLFPFFVFRKRFLQNVFLLSVSWMYAPVSVGVGMYVGINWFTSVPYPLLTANIASVSAIAVTLPPLLYFLKKLFNNPNINGLRIWRFIWLLPASFFCVFFISGNIFDDSAFTGAGFFIVRAFLYGALLLVCYLLETALRQSSEIILLRENTRLHESQIEMQKAQYARVMENDETIRALHHDLRHQAAVIHGYNDSGEKDKLREYMNEWTAALPSANNKAYCENFAVSAVAAHYLILAENEGVRIDAKLTVPEDTGSVSVMDLCVIMGSLLENAAEACRRVKNGSKYIRVRSRVESGMLSVVVENSFDGFWREADGVYLSMKQDGDTPLREGVGLASVKAICEKHGGLTQVEINGNVWRTSAIVKLED